jgi:hypothetical protein
MGFDLEFCADATTQPKRVTPANPLPCGLYGYTGAAWAAGLVDSGGRLVVNAGTGTNATDGAVAGDYVGPTTGAGGQLRGWNVTLSALNASGTFDRLRTATGAHNTTGTGLLGLGLLNYDGTSFQRSLCDTTGTLRTGRHVAAVKLALTVQAAAYGAADLVGGKLTFASVARVSGGAALLRGVVIGDQASNSAANSVYDLILFDSDPTGTTFTENSPLDVADADLNKIIGVVRFDGVAGTTLFANADNAVLFKVVELPLQLSGSTSLFGALIARGTPTYAATTDVFITLLLEQQ